jgi:hypothetical protein
MTFVGFEEKEIQEERNRIEKSFEAYKNLTEEEK